jgi:hypothetical protein
LVEYTRGGSRGYERVEADDEDTARTIAHNRLGAGARTWSIERRENMAGEEQEKQNEKKKKRFIVVTLVRFNGDDYEPGEEIEAGKHIKALIESGAVKEAE